MIFKAFPGTQPESFILSEKATMQGWPATRGFQGASFPVQLPV